MDCKYFRDCPKCSVEISYASIGAFKIACAKETNCISCRAKHRRRLAVVSDETRRKMSLAHTGEKNHFFGQKHSEHTRHLIGEKTTQRNQIGERNAFFGRQHSTETRVRMSKSRAQGLASGRIINTNKYGNKSWFVSNKTNERVRCDSTLEKFRMMQLDNDPNVRNWTKQHGIKIPYVFDGSVKHYVPDFLIITITDEKILEEVKGYDVKAREKLEALLKYCAENDLIARWVTQTELEQQGYRKFKDQ